MVKISYDTIKIREAGNDILRLSTELNNVLNTLYSRINNMPVNTKEWVGASAYQYVTRLNKEKARYLEFKNSLAAYGNYLLSVSNESENAIRKINI